MDEPAEIVELFLDLFLRADFVMFLDHSVMLMAVLMLFLVMVVAIWAVMSQPDSDLK